MRLHERRFSGLQAMYGANGLKEGSWFFSCWSPSNATMRRKSHRSGPSFCGSAAKARYDKRSNRSIGKCSRRMQQEVLGFASEWLNLHQNSPRPSEDFRFKKTNVLRKTILEERNAVLGELSDFVAEHESLVVRSSLECCRRSFEQIYALLQQPFPLTEPPCVMCSTHNCSACPVSP
jgi:hypothetical protein